MKILSVTKATAEDIEKIQDIKEHNLARIQYLKDQLSASDYKAIKFAEGEMTEEEFAPVREQRALWRAEINQLEATL